MRLAAAAARAGPASASIAPALGQLRVSQVGSIALCTQCREPERWDGGTAMSTALTARLHAIVLSDAGAEVMCGHLDRANRRAPHQSTSLSWRFFEPLCGMKPAIRPTDRTPFGTLIGVLVVSVRRRQYARGSLLSVNSSPADIARPWPPRRARLPACAPSSGVSTQGEASSRHNLIAQDPSGATLVGVSEWAAHGGRVTRR